MMSHIYEAPKETAKKIRKVLKAAFPQTKFSVTTDVYSMGSSINVSWQDGPLDCQVSPLVNQFQAGYFDSMQDMHIPGSYTCPFDGMQYSGAKHLFTKRELSPEYEARVHDFMQSYYSEPKNKNDYGYHRDFDHCDQKLFIQSLITPDETMLSLSKAYQATTGKEYNRDAMYASLEAIDAYVYDLKITYPAIKHLERDVITSFIQWCDKPAKAESLPEQSTPDQPIADNAFDSLDLDGYDLESESIEHEAAPIESIPDAIAPDLAIDGYSLDDSAPIETVKPSASCATCGKASSHIYCSYDCLPIEAPDEPTECKDVFYKSVKVGYTYKLKHALKFVETYTDPEQKRTYNLNPDLDSEAQAIMIFTMAFESKLKKLHPVTDGILSVLNLDSAYIDLLPFMSSKDLAYNLTIIASDPSDSSKLCIGHILTDGSGFTFSDHAYSNIDLMSATNLLNASIMALEQVATQSRMNRHLHLDFKTSDELPVLVKSFDGSMLNVGRVFESTCTGSNKWYFYNATTDLIESIDSATDLDSAITGACVYFKTAYATNLYEQCLIHKEQGLFLGDVLDGHDGPGVIAINEGVFKFQGMQHVTLTASTWYDAVIEVVTNGYHLMPEAIEPEPIDLDPFDNLDLDIEGYSLECDDTSSLQTELEALPATSQQATKPAPSVLNPLNTLYAEFFKSQAWMVAA